MWQNEHLSDLQKQAKTTVWSRFVLNHLMFYVYLKKKNNWKHPNLSAAQQLSLQSIFHTPDYLWFPSEAAWMQNRYAVK